MQNTWIFVREFLWLMNTIFCYSLRVFAEYVSKWAFVLTQSTWWKMNSHSQKSQYLFTIGIAQWQSEILTSWPYSELLKWGKFVNMIILHIPQQICRQTVWLPFGLWLTVRAHGWWFILQTLLTGSWVLRCSPVLVFGCGHSQLPRRAGALSLCNEYVLALRNKASLFNPSGERDGKCSTMCLVTPIMKPSSASFGVSSWRFFCWTEETLGFGPNGVCLPPLPLFYQYDTLLKQLLQTEADSFRGLDFK